MIQKDKANQENLEKKNNLEFNRLHYEQLSNRESALANFEDFFLESVGEIKTLENVSHSNIAKLDNKNNNNESASFMDTLFVTSLG